MFYLGASLVAQMVKNLPIMGETWVRSSVGKIPWRRAWQPTTVFLPGASPWTEKPGGLQSTGSQRVGWCFILSSVMSANLNVVPLDRKPENCMQKYYREKQKTRETKHFLKNSWENEGRIMLMQSTYDNFHRKRPLSLAVRVAGALKM